jgi:hypothetical protein
MGTIKHAKTSTIPAPNDLLRINGPDWNEEHEFDLEIADVNGLTEALIPPAQVVEYRDQALAAAVTATEARIGAEAARDEAVDILDESVKTADLAADTGATMVGVAGGGNLQLALNQRPTSTAIAAAYATKASLRVNVASFGGDPAAGDNTAAVDAAFGALGALTTHGGALEFGPGRWRLQAGRAVPKKCSIVGVGMDATVFEPLTAGTLFATDLTAETPFPGSPEANVGFYDFQIDCVALANVVGIVLTNCRNTVCQNLKFRGCSTNILIDRGRNHSVDTIFSQGTASLKCGGLVFTSSSDADYIFETHIRSVYFFNNYVTGTAAVLVYIRRAALLTLADVTINDGWQGNVSAAVAIMLENDCQGCKVSNSVFAAVSNGLVMQVGVGIAAAPTYCTVSDIDIDQARGTGMLIESAAWNVFNNCKLSSSGVMITLSALTIRNGAQGNVFTGCNFQGYNGVGGKGVELQDTSDLVIENCIFGQCETGVSFGANVLRAQVHSNIWVAVTNKTAGAPGDALSWLPEADLLYDLGTAVMRWNNAYVSNLRATGSLGFTTGGGGTVTQLTNKSTNVTLNKPSGEIITHAASLAAGTTVAFALLNSAIGANDIVLVKRKSGGTNLAYRVDVDVIGAGFCNVTIQNTTAGALAEAITLTFIVLKVAIS